MSDAEDARDGSSADGLPTSPDELFAMLAGEGIDVVTVSHPAVHTVEQSRELHVEIPGGHIKNLFVKDKKGKVFLIVAEAEARIDLKRVHTVIGGSGRVSFGKPDLLMDLLGVRPGAVTPFALVNDRENRVSCILDAPLMSFDVLNCHPMVNTMTTSIARDDLLRFLAVYGHAPRVVAVSGGIADSGGG